MKPKFKTTIEEFRMVPVIRVEHKGKLVRRLDGEVFSLFEIDFVDSLSPEFMRQVRQKLRLED